MFVKHRRMKDVCLSVVEKDHVNGHIRLKGVWINIANGEPFIIPNNKGAAAMEVFEIPFGVWQAEWSESEECFPYGTNTDRN